MKVLKNNYKETISSCTNSVIESYPKKYVCEKCESELEYEKSDLKYGDYGCAYIECPLCKYKNYIDEEQDLTLTTNNIEFPTHFHHTSKETGAVDVCRNDIVKKWINEGIEYLRTQKDEFYWLRATGNMYMIIFRLEDDEDYEIFISDSHYETYIPFKSEDY